MNLFDRVFQLHRLMAGRRTALPFKRIEEELECSRATARRVIEHLRDLLGAPLIYDREAGGYRYDGDGLYELPGLWFSANELAALLTLDALTAAEPSGLVNTALAPFRTRLESLLEKEGLGLPGWRARLRLLDAHARNPGPHFATVAGALAARRRIAISYAARGSGETSQRTVSPQRLTRYRGNWYLDAWCHGKSGLRTFALEQIGSVQASEAVAIEVPEPQLDAELAASYGIFSGAPSHIAELRFSAFAARWVAGESWHPAQTDTWQPDGSLLRRIPYANGVELLQRVLEHGPDVEVLGPEPLRAAVKNALEAALAAYS